MSYNGKNQSSYSNFSNYLTIADALPGATTDNDGLVLSSTARGQISAPFVAKLNRVGFCTVTLKNKIGTQEEIKIEMPVDWYLVFTADGKIRIQKLKEGQTANFASDSTDIWEKIETTGKTEFTTPVGNYLSGWSNEKTGEDEKKCSTYSTGTSSRVAGGILITGSDTFYSQWGELRKITFYKALTAERAAWYLVEGALYNTQTGIQELYGAFYQPGESSYTELSTNLYRGTYSDTGKKGEITLPVGTKVRVFVKRNPKYGYTTCHINVADNILSSGETSPIMANDPTYEFTLSRDTHIVFEETIELKDEYKYVFGVQVYVGKRKKSENWNCYILDSAPNIKGGVILG